jgi:hypothetical protein
MNIHTMKRPREDTNENRNDKRQTTLSSFVIKPKLPAYFHLHHSSKDDTFKATFTDVNHFSGTDNGFEAKIYWPCNDIPITLTTNIKNGTFEDQDVWQQKCKQLSSTITNDHKKHFEKLETMFLEAVGKRDSSTVLSTATAMACFERDWSGSPVNGLRRLLQIISALDIDKEDQSHYAVLVWLQCAETKGFMVSSNCVDYLLSYIEKISRQETVSNDVVSQSNIEPKRRPKPTLDRILLLRDKGAEIRDLLLAMYIRSEFLSSRQGEPMYDFDVDSKLSVLTVF